VGVFGSMLATHGFHSSGSEIMYNGMTGEQIEMEVFFGPTYYMRLKHMVKDKINYRATGPRTALTRQPVAGRANDGGLRIGEMERDVLISHGITNFLTESMMVRGDNVRLAVCNTTGAVAICNPSNNLWLSPLADGPLKFKPTIVSGDTGVALETVSKYGRSFSMVEVPYSFKLLMQELQAVNIQMRIITENNISQIDSISNSDNVQRLTHVDGLDKVLELGAAEIEKYKKREQENNQRMHPRKAEPSVERYSRFVAARRSEDTQEIEDRNEYPVGSPAYPPGSPAYPPGSPAYPPGSPAYPPGSPAYPPGSPAYPPGSPAYPAGSPGWTPPPPSWIAPKTPSLSPPSKTQNPNITQNINPRYVPDSPSQSGGGRNIEEGTDVLYRGSANMGLSPESLWKVRRIGDGFITIDNQAFEGSDSVQVVSPDELFLPTPEFYSNLVQQQTQMPMPIPMPMQMQGPGGGIHINPIIKIVNGPDHSVNAGEADTQSMIPEKRPALSPASSMPEGPKKELTGVDFSKGILINKLE
jgi:hypothetical protein